MTPAPTPAPTPVPSARRRSVQATSPRRAPADSRVFVEGTASGGAPQQYRVGGRHYVVTQVHGHWVTGTPWWLTGQDVDTHTWRVSVRVQGNVSSDQPDSGVVDLRCAGSHWRITRAGGAR
jgi:hypothetical protein